METVIVCGQNDAFSTTNGGLANFYKGIDKSMRVTGVDCDELPDLQRCTTKFSGANCQISHDDKPKFGGKKVL